MSDPIVRVAVPVPVRCGFDYRAQGPAPAPGTRVRVPFGRREQVGVVMTQVASTPVATSRLKAVLEVLDREPILPPPLLALLEWAADYYRHPIGEVIASALPSVLRAGAPAASHGPELWRLTPTGRALDRGRLRRAPAQRRLLDALLAEPVGLSREALADVHARWRSILTGWQEAGWVERTQAEDLPVPVSGETRTPDLTSNQREALTRLRTGSGYRASLLFGVTGSGKTEVYLQLVADVLAAGRQALVLVPEIGLTPQLVARFRARFRAQIVVLHSGLGDGERLGAWLAARDGRAGIVLGTRSAVFTPLACPGLIIVDEEHDLSFKQQDGFRYHARDIAVMRAHRDNVPIVLGSATPSLETLHNVQLGRYGRVELPQRAGGAALPAVHVLDLRRLPLIEGLAQPLLGLISDRIARGEQSLVFLNRRGYAPALMCYDCRWIAPCPRCDAKFTLHRGARPQLHCHHCGAQRDVPVACPACGGARVRAIGEGTQRVEAALSRYLPSARIVRIDRDSTRRKGSFEAQLARVHGGDADVLVGTQMLSKGHDFPNVTLVAVLNADQGLYGSDFRASEHMLQQIVQVAGRAGRADKAGEVYVQTFYPEHPLFAALKGHDYATFADHVLRERADTHLPPITHLALLRAESSQARPALRFLECARERGFALKPADGLRIFDAVPAVMERRAGRYRAQLLVESAERRVLHAFLGPWLDAITALREGKRVRWSLDIDPMSLL